MMKKYLQNLLFKSKINALPELKCRLNCRVPFNKRPCEKKPDNPEMPGNITASGEGLIHKSLEIGRAMAAKGRLSLKASGTCMYPNVRQGDFLFIAPVSASEFKVGDIAVCRKPAYLFAHRVIATGTDDNGKSYIVTCSDRNKGGSDGRTYDENILGRVNKIERKSKAVSLARQEYLLPVEIFHESVLKMHLFLNRLKILITRLDGCIHASRPYRLAGRLWWRFAGCNAEYSIHVPLHPENAGSFEKKIRIEDFDEKYLLPGGVEAIDLWKIVITLNGQKTPAASLAVARSPEGCVTAGWWADDMHVRLRYRGTGIEDALIEKAICTIKNCGLNMHLRTMNR